MSISLLPSAASRPVKITGQPGRVVVLPSGIRIECRSYNGVQVTEDELQQAINGLSGLPAADQLLVARLGVPIHLIPASGLENAIVGATDFDIDGEAWQPRGIRIALRGAQTLAGVPRDQIGEIVQHEVGHVIAVTRSNDRSEDTAERYAATY